MNNIEYIDDYRRTSYVLPTENICRLFLQQLFTIIPDLLRGDKIIKSSRMTSDNINSPPPSMLFYDGSYIIPDHGLILIYNVSIIDIPIILRYITGELFDILTYSSSDFLSLIKDVDWMGCMRFIIESKYSTNKSNDILYKVDAELLSATIKVYALNIFGLLNSFQLIRFDNVFPYHISNILNDFNMVLVNNNT